MSDISISDIRRNTGSFSFVDALGSFINNYEFKQGYDQLKLSNDNKYSYIWSVLSTIGDDYANTIYENVLNYIDNVANVDLCKVKSLQSMIKVLGIDYDVVNDISKMPVEIASLIDILSVNKRYLLDNTTFSVNFHDMLKKYDYGKCVISAIVNDMSAELSNATMLNNAASCLNEADVIVSVQLSDYVTQSSYIDNAQYKLMLVDMFKQVIESNIYMQYADAENDMSSANMYIYQYIASKLLANDNDSADTSDSYDEQIESLKIKYRLHGFKQDEVMDAIENGTDYIGRYNQYQQEVLSAEQKRRNSTYAYTKAYAQSEDSSEGYSLTRYSWYREQKVAEYFRFVEDTYSGLTNAKSNDIESVLKGTSNTNVHVYDKDNDYFVIDQMTKSSLLYYDSTDTTPSYKIRATYINVVAELLAQQVLDLADIREQVKIQLRKSYMKGTFLLLSYVINEYLKYDISKNYGNVVYTQDENVPLSSYIDECIKNNGVQIVEYKDPTEYFNISSSTDLCAQAALGLSILNIGKSNQKFYDNEESKLGETSQDIPLEEIDYFYRKQLDLHANGVQTSSDLVNFLSLVYDYGANESFLADRSDDTSSSFRLSGEFYCRLWNEALSTQQWQGDIDTSLQLYQSKLSTAETFSDHVEDWMSASFVTEHTYISTQMESLSSFISCWWEDKLSTDNTSFRTDAIQKKNDSLYYMRQTSADMMNISSSFDDIKNDEKYEVYFAHYHDPAYAESMHDKLTSFYASCQIECDDDNTLFKNESLSSSVQALSSDYVALDKQLGRTLSVLVREDGYWPYYYTNAQDEITSQTQSLATFLQEQQESLLQQQMQHFQNHLNALVSYKNEILNYINTCNNAHELFSALSNEVDTVMHSMTVQQAHLSDAYDIEYNYWIEQSNIEVLYKGHLWNYGTYHGSSPAILTSMPITEQLEKIEQRCLLYSNLFTAMDKHYNLEQQEMTCYVNIGSQIFRNLCPESSKVQILTSLSTMAEQYKQSLSCVNTELICLNVDDWKISNTEAVTSDNVCQLFKSMLTDLLKVIQKLDDDYVKLNQQVTTDRFYMSNANLLQRIQYLLSADERADISSCWNVAKIDNTYISIDERFQQLKDDQSTYLNEYADTKSGRLSKQFLDMLKWSKSHDIQSRITVLEELSSSIITPFEDLDTDFRQFAGKLDCDIVSNVGNDKKYVISTQSYEYVASLCLEKLIIDVEEWLDKSLDVFDTTAKAAIQKAIPLIAEYADEIKLIEDMSEMMKKSTTFDRDDLLLQDAVALFMKELEDMMSFIESQRNHYDIQKEIFLKYNGTDVGYDPFYNFKNVTHSSYQIHPYLYNFVEDIGLEYPLANTFFIAFTEEYEKQMVQTGLDQMIGKYGNVINLSKCGMLDWTGYQSQYERDFSSESDVNIRQLPEQFAYAGAFYPPALEEFLADSPAFIQKVQDNTPDSYYYKLNLSQEELNKISEQLRIYEKPIREIARCPRDEKSRDCALSAEYDIYKYTQDIYGNSLILFKSYKHLYRENADVESYAPSFNEKKNTPGELWMRIKNHPIAFPAFDLRADFIELTQYYNTSDITDPHKLNSYISIANDYFSDSSKFTGTVGGVSLADVTKDTIQLCFASAQQHMRCFFDMELSPDKRSLLLVVPMQTGTSAKRGKQDWSTFTYGNTNIVVGRLWQDYDYVKDMNMYAFQAANIAENVEDVTNNVDNIRPSIDLLTTSDVPSTGMTREVTEFVGFAKHSNYIIAVFVHKFWYSRGKMLKSFTSPVRRNATPQLQLECWCYNGTRKRSITATQDMAYDVLYKESDDYKYANSLAIASNNDIFTVCYISDEFQKAYKLKPGSAAQAYTADTTIVNFTEYTNVVDNHSLTAFGQNVKYPSDTAILQTTDAQHINIYNSFDSFTSYIVNVDFKFVGSRIVAKQVRHYNLNTDCGYYPLFADTHGKSRLYANSALSSKNEYSFELLGPENSDIDYTPVILDTNVQEQNGRVTEDYKDYTKMITFNEQLDVSPGASVVTCMFDLRSIFVDDNGNSTYDDLAETGTLTKYRWNIANTSYAAMPVARGTLAQPSPTDYYYISSSMYDTLSGQEIFGPNGVTFQGTTNVNHIDGISAIGVEVLFNDDKLPEKICLSVQFDGRYDMSGGAVIQENQFQLIVYIKNSNITYDYYHIIENGLSNDRMEKMLRVYADEISFKDISVLSDFQIDGKFPFRNISSETDYKKMIAPYMFKYSEEDAIDREFPLLAASDVEDEVVYLANEDQYIYFFAIDGYDNIDKDIFYMDKYDIDTNKYVKAKVNTISKKYKDFYDKALTIQTTYNVEEVDDGYGIVLYFNYKNFTSPQYINFEKRYAVDGTPQPPKWSVCTSMSPGLDNTYLRLAPGKSGQLDMRVDYVEYAKVYATDLMQSVVGKETRVIRTYYIMNVSDDKPKFIISRQPFK